MALDTGFRRCDGLFSVSLMRSKGIANPFDVFFRACIEQNAVKAAFCIGFGVSRCVLAIINCGLRRAARKQYTQQQAAARLDETVG